MYRGLPARISGIRNSGDDLPDFCETLVRKHDYDRYLAALFAPGAARAGLVALYAFNYETAKIAESVRNAMAGQIRLQWWREAIEEIYAGRPGRTELLKQLAVAIAAHRLPQSLFESMLEARELDLEQSPFPDARKLESYCDASSGNLVRLAARILGADDRLDGAAGEAGTAYAITGLLRALAFNAARSRAILPGDEMARAAVSARDIMAGRSTPGLCAVLARMAGIARAHYLRIGKIERRFLPAILPAALVPGYLRIITRQGFDPFRDSSAIPGYRRQLIFLHAIMRGQV